MLKFLQRIATMNGPSWVVPRLLSKMADGGHIEFRKMLISPYSIKVFVHKIWYKDVTRQRGHARDQKRNRKLICMTSLSRLRATIAIWPTCSREC